MTSEGASNANADVDVRGAAEALIESALSSHPVVVRSFSSASRPIPHSGL